MSLGKPNLGVSGHNPVDLAIPDCAVLIEFDGMVKYGDLLRGNLTPQQVLMKEKRREDALRELGWLVLRVTWADLADRARFADRLSNALARGRRIVELPDEGPQLYRGVRRPVIPCWCSGDEAW